MPISINKKTSDEALRAHGATLDRTRAPGWVVTVADSAPDIGAALRQDPAALEAAALGWARVGAQLPRGALSSSERGVLSRQDPPAQSGWVRSTALAMDAAAAVTGVDGKRLGDLVDCDALLRALRTFAGQAKDAALGTRIVISAFGWHEISRVLEDLRATLPSLDDAGQRRLLADFAPMLTLLAQIQEEQGESREELAAARKEAEALVSSAQAEARREETRLALRSGAEVPEEDLLALAEHEAQRAAPAAALANRRRGRRSRR